MASGSARAVISSVVSSTFITTRCLSKRRVNEVPWFARVGELAARLSSDEATTTSTELGILRTTDQLVEKFGFVDDVDSVQKGQLCKEPLFTPPHSEDAEEPPSISGQLSEGLTYHLDAPFEDKLAESFDIRTLHTLKGCSLRWLQRSRKALCIWRDKLYAANTPERLDTLMLQLQISSAAIAMAIPGAAPAACPVDVPHDQVAQELVTLLAPLKATRNSQMRRAYVQALCSLRSPQGECGWLLCVANCLNDEVKTLGFGSCPLPHLWPRALTPHSPLLLLRGAQSSTVREAVAEGLARYLGPVSSRVVNSIHGLLHGQFDTEREKYPKILNGEVWKAPLDFTPEKMSALQEAFESGTSQYEPRWPGGSWKESAALNFFGL